MNIQSFFQPVASFLLEKTYPENSFFNQILIHRETFPDIANVKIAFVGLKESRGVRRSESMERGSSEIREKLYELKKGTAIHKVADLGDLISGESLNETYQNIRQVGEYLMKRQVLPIFFGGSHDLDFGQYLAYQKLKKLVTLVTIDAKIDMDESGTESDRHTQEIVLYQPNFLFSSNSNAIFSQFLYSCFMILFMENSTYFA
jgi:arginase family enzyme